MNESYSGYLSIKRNISEAEGNERLASITANARRLGLDYHFDKTIMANSFRAYCLIQFAKTKGKGAEMEEILFKAFFTDGKMFRI